MFRCHTIVLGVFALLFSAVGSASAVVSYRVTDLGTLGGSWSEAFGINATGQVVGQGAAAGNVSACAFLYDNGSINNLGALGGSSSWALGINATGQVVGSAGTAT